MVVPYLLIRNILHEDYLIEIFFSFSAFTHNWGTGRNGGTYISVVKLYLSHGGGTGQ